MRAAYKFLAAGATSPFTGFRWPGVGVWVVAPADREPAWVFACRKTDLPCWLEHELWRIELGEPVRERAHQLTAPRARLAGRVEAWNPELRRRYAEACAWRARELAQRALPPELCERIARTDDLAALAAAARGAAWHGAAAAYLADASALARNGEAAAASYLTCLLAGAAGGARAFEAERAWQARWLAEHLALEP